MTVKTFLWIDNTIKTIKTRQSAEKITCKTLDIAMEDINAINSNLT